ncbi:MAG: type II secretion system secretin GspD [Bdellovibrionales bacterium]|nr:type II secretion system secretin GspD [Bdellovibrionales bacterium]
MKYSLKILISIFLIMSSMALAQTGLPKGGKVSLDFHDVEIKDVILAIAEITGKNFIVDEKVRGKLSIISSTPVGIEDAYQVFLTALQTKGFTTEEVGSVTKIISIDDANRSGVPPIGPEGEIPGNSGQIITKILPLKFIDANQIQQALRYMVSRAGSIVGYGPTNSLIITDSVSNILRLEKIISKLDKQTFENSVEVIPIKHAQADDVAQKLLTIFEEEQNKAGKSRTRRDNIEGGVPVTSIMPDTRSNSLIVMATRKGIEKILDLLAELDRPLTGKSKSGIHFVKLKHAKADELAETLSSLLSGSSGSTKKSKSSNKSSSQDRSSSSSASSTSSSAGRGSSSRANGPSSESSVSAKSDAQDSLLSGIFQGEVRVVSDANTNSLIVTAAPNDYEALFPIIEKLDSRRAQVLVESLIMEVSLNKDAQVGLSLHGGGGAAGLAGIAATGLTPIAPLGIENAIKGLAGSMGGLVLGAATEKSITLPGTKMRLPISGATFKALQENKYINVLSSPNILTTDNRTAEIAIGKKVPITSTSINLTGDATPVSQTTREPVELRLTVTPQINDGDEVTLEVEQLIQEIDESEQQNTGGNPTTSERRTLTTIVANNGQTVVIGGLIKDKDEKRVTKVPLLGDIPLVGYLFRDNKRVKEKTNLLLFLTPHIIRDPADMTRVSVMRNDQRRAFNKSNNIPENHAIYDYELDKGLNMAPPASALAPKKPTKRFDYENYTIENAKNDEGEEQLTRRREEKKPNESVESARVQESKRDTNTSDSGNPFAEIRPPSSTAN